MPIRRIVTGVNEQGKSVLVADGPSHWHKQFEYTRVFASTVVWQTQPIPSTVSRGDGDPTKAIVAFVPAPGGTTFVVVTFPPNSVMSDADVDHEAAMREHSEQPPGFLDYFESSNPGMHKTPTIDYGIVLQGEIWLELDDGKTVQLKQRDVVVQNGARHAWRNRSDIAATMASY